LGGVKGADFSLGPFNRGEGVAPPVVELVRNVDFVTLGVLVEDGAFVNDETVDGHVRPRP
jgi:hypothetical protein